MSSRPYGPRGPVSPAESPAAASRSLSWPSLNSRGVTRTSRDAPDIASELNSSVTRAPNDAAALVRAALSVSAAAKAALYSDCRSASSSATFSGEASRSSKSNVALSRHAITSAKVGPQRRVSSFSS